jgi:O-glycosyl hydrolase
MPSQKGNDDQYYDTVMADNEVKQEITRLAMEAYGGDIVQAGTRAYEEPPPFGDDDIPF